jgi:excinuclease ABC subunit A
VIEHNLDVIKTADWIVDLGPEGGVNGGLVVAEGTPEQVAAAKGSYTGQYLKPLLERSPVADFTLTAPKAKARRGKTRSLRPRRRSKIALSLTHLFLVTFSRSPNLFYDESIVKGGD